MSLALLDEFELCQAFIEYRMSTVEALGLAVNINYDLMAWRQVLNRTNAHMSKALDPSLNDIHAREGFWFSFVDGKGNIVACAGARMIQTKDFIRQHVATHRLFGDQCPVLRPSRLTFVDPPNNIAGTIGFGGGSWVRPDWRGNNLAGAISQLWRAMCLRDFCVDFCIGFTEVRGKPEQSENWGRKTLGWPNRAHMLTGFYPGRPGVENVQMLWASAEEIRDMCVELLPMQDNREIQAIA